MRDRAPRLVDEMLLNGLHVHVGVADEEDRVRVLNGIRPWLPVLTALTANSPFWDGDDSGFASWRTIHFARWPVSGPPPAFADRNDYELRAEALLATGALVDRGQLYWQARLSERYPTVEMRVADAQLSVADSVVSAGLLRALVLTELHRPTLNPPATDELLRAAVWQAARDDLSGTLLDPVSGEVRPALAEVDRLHEHVQGALVELGDDAQVAGLLDRRRETGTGAARQRRAYEKAGLAGVLELVASEFVSG
jgi:carboxylate-amine ligase